MREIKIGEKIYGVRATTLALLFYKQEFKHSLLTDYVKASQEAQDNGGIFDEVILLQLLWAMHKADGLPEKVSGFDSWIETLGNINFGDPALYKNIIEEAADGFFQKPLAKGPAPVKRTPKKK
jgi:hypothetical protein